MYHPLYPLKSLRVKKFRKEPLLRKVMEKGVRVDKAVNLSDIAAFSREQIRKLPPEYKRFDYPHLYKVGLSEKLKNERDRLMAEYRK